MKNSAIKFNLSKKAKAHLSSLILSSHCGMILVNDAKKEYEKTGDFAAYDKTVTAGFRIHDRAILELNEILGSDIARYRYQTMEDL
jgi:hypothetical protein